MKSNFFMFFILLPTVILAEPWKDKVNPYLDLDDEAPPAQTQAKEVRSEKAVKTLKKILKPKSRQLASQEPVRIGESRVTGRLPKRLARKSELTFDVHLLAGTSGTEISDLAKNSGGEGMSSNLIDFAGDIDVRYQYFGVELEGSYASGAAEAEIQTIGTEERSQSVSSFMAAVKAQTQFVIEKIIVTPKIGLGFGNLSVQETSTSALLESSLSRSLSGVYGLVGFDVRATAELGFGLDYAMSFSASGLEVLNEIDELEVEGGSFSRLRVNGHYHISPLISLGLQFTMRQINFTESVSLNSIQGLLGFSW